MERRDALPERPIVPLARSIAAGERRSLTGAPTVLRGRPTAACPSGLRGRIANPFVVGSNPTAACVFSAGRADFEISDFAQLRFLQMVMNELEVSATGNYNLG